MTVVWPLRFRDNGSDLIFADEAGGWFASDAPFLQRYTHDGLTEPDLEFLRRGGHAFERAGDLFYSAYLQRWTRRHNAPSGQLGYVILVPTLRCNLACDYCQVSRADEHARGFDWDEPTLNAVLGFLDRIPGNRIKIEFQGGEPFLRLDLLEKVRAFCRSRFATCTFVVCSNFQFADDAVWDFLSSDDTYLSTSIDGDIATHTRQRTHSGSLTEAFLANLAEFVRRFGQERLSALPTIDLANPVDADALIEAYERHGLRSIYLRPVNRQGFARRAPEPVSAAASWADYHRRFIFNLIERNHRGAKLEEYYFTHALRRVTGSNSHLHVDLRNPNLLGDGYVVVDYDGTLYPTDEARMMSRVGQIDLSIGDVTTGIDHEKVAPLNASSFNDLDPDCQHCVFQPYCGTDNIDDISRYGRIDVPRHATWFCQRHLALFDLVFELLRSEDPKVIHSLKQWSGLETWPSYLSRVHR